MDGEIRDVVTEWGTRPVADGVAGLYDLADGSFSGAVTDGTTWAFVLNGRFVGVFDGDVEAFEEASLTAYVAPDLSLPLLFAMRERGGEVRGEYYSNDTPLREIDDTLSSGNFVGYVELSENVLSGDYYVVYYGGRSLPAAYVGNSRRLLTGDEAFERAADEVGIYSVVDAEVEVVDLPERPEPDPGSEPEPAPDPASTTDHPDVAMTPAASDDPAGENADVAIGDGEEADGADGDAAAVAERSDDAPDPPRSADHDADPTGATPASPSSATDAAAAPSDTADIEDGSTEHPSTGHTPDESTSDPTRESGDTPATAAPDSADPAETERLRDRIAELETELERLEADDAPTAERTLTPDEALAGTHLFVRYDDRADGTLADATAAQLDPDALRANLRLDYHTQFETTGTHVDGEPFESFLRGTSEHRFVEWLLTELFFEIQRTDAAGLSKLYDALDRIDRIDFGGEVAVGDETAADGDAEAEAGAAADAASFDVVFRTKMSDPLFVGAFETSREPTRAGPIRSLIDDARSVSETTSSLAAAFFVTTSFFDADAMEVAVDATRGGLFSRSSRRSYVKLSRKAGFHLCLVEARDGEFYLTEPDL